jgi:hypothetical protein
MPRKDKKNFLAQNYDKLILAAAALTLAVSVAMLLSLAEAQQRNVDKFEAEIAKLSPKNPSAKKLEGREFDKLAKSAAAPLAMPAGKTMLAAPERMLCVSERCALPIPYSSETCPYCGEKQPTGEVPEDWDSDGDGMPDWWEEKYGLNKENPADATGDLDGDGFTNFEEFRAGTDPTDPASHPALIDYLRVAKIDMRAFPFIVNGKTKSGDVYTFQINEPATKRSYYVKTNAPIAKTAWKIVSYEFVTRIESRTGMPDREVELAVLKLSDGTDEVVLEERGPPVYNTYVVTFVCPKQSNNEDITVQQKESFEFDGAKYTVARIIPGRKGAPGSPDVPDVAVIRHLESNKEIHVKKE